MNIADDLRPHPSPASLGFRMPAEWEPQEAIWFSWPSGNPQNWPGTLHRVEAVFARIAACVSQYEKVRINTDPAKRDAILSLLCKAGASIEQVELFDHVNDDVWCRDHGPIFLKHRESGEIAATNWEFNGWGGKFEPYLNDNRIPEQVTETLSLRRFDSQMVLEGGSIEVNSLGQLLTTEAVLLNPNRNPGLSRREIEKELCDMLGVKEIFWLGRGIEGDDTDGHIDDLARFANDNTILITTERDSSSPNHQVLAENRERIDDFCLPGGSKPEIVEIQMPAPCLEPDWRLPFLPASYVNFLILNGAVLVPVFGQKEADNNAVGLIGELFPNREIIPINVIDLVKEGGAIHCITQQQPA
ncbi:MAG: agmatine deiminase family protein [Verrucomicrobiales bacterium]|nr:agmatine deiminase family protein [Verrucomicrobiales bacterium]